MGCGIALIAGLFLPAGILQAGALHPALTGPSRFILEGDSIDVWVMFTDRHLTDAAARQSALQTARDNLLPRAEARRAKTGRAALVSETDLPVYAPYARAVLETGARFRTTSRYLNAVSVRVPVSLLERLAEYPSVKEIRPVAKAWRPLPDPDWAVDSEGGMVQAQPAEPDTVLSYGNSYSQLNQIGVVAAHLAGYTGAGVLVCLLDTGFFTDHQSLVTRPIMAEWDFINNDPETANQPGDPSSQHNHGTYTFSALGGAYSGQLYGPAFGATFIIGKTEMVDEELPIEEDYYVAGMEWADSLGAEVISTSLGYYDWYTFADLDGNTCVTTICVDQTVANGVVCVTAAGNERLSAWAHIIAPADADSVITVGAVSSTGLIASFSSPGPTYDGRIKPEVCARGVNVRCASPSSITGYVNVSGTSLSTPLLGGAAALVVEAHPDWSPMQVREALMMTASMASSPNNDYGWGIINVMTAINYSFTPPAPVEIILTPVSAPITIPVGGGSFNFNANLHNVTDSSATFNAWIGQYTPAGLYQGPMLGPLTLTLFPGANITRVRIQNVPGSAAPGTYTYVGYTGQYPDVKWDSSYFSYTKLGAGDGEATVGDWACTGDPFPGEVIAGGPRFVVASDFSLSASPNPFNPTTALSYELRAASHVSLRVYDTAGREVATLVDGMREAGSHEMTFDASGLPSGMYFARLTAGGYTAVQKVVLVK